MIASRTIKAWKVRVIIRVHQTGRNRSGYRGYRSNRPGPVPIPAGFKPAQIQILNLNSKKWKNPKKILKILQVATNLMMSNFFKYSFIYYTLRAFEVKKKYAYKSIQIQCISSKKRVGGFI